MQIKLRCVVITSYFIEYQNENNIIATLGYNVDLFVHLSCILIICALSCIYVIF